MSTESTPPPGPRPLGAYVAALVDELGRADREALARMRRIVGRRRASIELGDEAVEVGFGHDALVVIPATGAAVDGEGITDRQTVLDMLDARLEVTDAILDGRLHVRGTTDAVVRMFTAIEILLDASPRAPALQRLASHFRATTPRPPGGEPLAAAPTRRTAWFPAERAAGEDAVLARHGLLPEPGQGGDAA